MICISDLMAEMAEAGAPIQAVLIAVRAIEAERRKFEQQEAERKSKEAARTRLYRQRGGGKIDEGMRGAVFERDSYECVYCGSSEYLQCDHVIPVSKGGETTLENLVTACRTCNTRKKDKDRKAFERSLSKEVRGQSTEQNTPPCSPPFLPPTPPNQSPPIIPPKNSRRIRAADSELDAEFEEFWQAYPRREGSNPKSVARQKFAIARKTASQDQILSGLRSYAASVSGNDPRFIAQASTWLNQSRWADDYGPPKSNVFDFEAQQRRLRDEAARKFGIAP